MNQFSVGDIVQIRSGGPKMTVILDSDASEMVKCAWFKSDSYLSEHSFLEYELYPSRDLNKNNATNDGVLFYPDIIAINKGAIVQLASGGPLMTVEDLDQSGKTITCSWPVEKKLQIETFPRTSLLHRCELCSLVVEEDRIGVAGQCVDCFYDKMAEYAAPRH